MKKFIKKYGSILLITILIGALISVFISMVVYGRIGMTGNQSTMYAGFLGLVGGIVGAFSAYFIARMQMTKQLDLQYKKEYKKLKTEMYLELHNQCVNHLLKIRKYLRKLSQNTDEIIIEIEKNNYKKISDINAVYIEKMNKLTNIMDELVEEHIKYAGIYGEEDFNYFQNKVLNRIITSYTELVENILIRPVKETREEFLEIERFYMRELEEAMKVNQLYVIDFIHGKQE